MPIVSRIEDSIIVANLQISEDRIYDYLELNPGWILNEDNLDLGSAINENNV